MDDLFVLVGILPVFGPVFGTPLYFLLRPGRRGRLSEQATVEYANSDIELVREWLMQSLIRQKFTLQQCQPHYIKARREPLPNFSGDPRNSAFNCEIRLTKGSEDRVGVSVDLKIDDYVLLDSGESATLKAMLNEIVGQQSAPESLNPAMGMLGIGARFHWIYMAMTFPALLTGTKITLLTFFLNGMGWFTWLAIGLGYIAVSWKPFHLENPDEGPARRRRWAGQILGGLGLSALAFALMVTAGYQIHGPKLLKLMNDPGKPETVHAVPENQIR